MFRKAIVSLFAIAGLAIAQTNARTPFIRASGEGVVSIKPDQAKITMSVTTDGATAEEATGRNADIITAVLAAVRTALGTGGDVRTIGFNVSPMYRSPGGGQPSVIVGYTATNSVEVTMSDTTGVGRIIDVGTKAGANSIGGIRFSLKDAQPVRAQALRLATMQARAQADAIAQGLGGRVGRIFSAADSAVAASTVQTPGILTGVAATTPIDSGNLEVRATVTIEAEFLIL